MAHAHVWEFHPTAAAQCQGCRKVQMDLDYWEAMNEVFEAAKVMISEPRSTTSTLVRLVAAGERVEAMRAVYRGDRGAAWPKIT